MAKKSLKYVTDEAVEELAKSWTMSKAFPNFTTKGYVYSKEARKKMSDSAKKRVKRLGMKHDNNKGLHRYNNGIKNIMALKCPEGFKPGWIKREK